VEIEPPRRSPSISNGRRMVREKPPDHALATMPVVARVGTGYVAAALWCRQASRTAGSTSSTVTP
jgi:hypothetical protein